MKKLICVFVALLASISASFAGMDDVTFNLSSITTNADSETYVVRGSVEAVNVVIPSGKTATVAFATASGVTLFSKSMTSSTDGYFPIRYNVYGSTGSLLTYQATAGAAANTYTNSIVDRIGIAESVTATVTPADNTTGTNSYTATLIINK